MGTDPKKAKVAGRLLIALLTKPLEYISYGAWFAKAAAMRWLGWCGADIGRVGSLPTAGFPRGWFLFNLEDQIKASWHYRSSPEGSRVDPQQKNATWGFQMLCTLGVPGYSDEPHSKGDIDMWRAKDMGHRQLGVGWWCEVWGVTEELFLTPVRCAGMRETHLRVALVMCGLWWCVSLMYTDSHG